MIALIPAAGQSSRMGRPKLLLPLGERTILEALIGTLQRAGIAEILVVVGPHIAELTAMARGAGAHVLELPESTPDMRSTVERGLVWIEERFHPAPDDAWLLVPADHPVLDATAVQQLIATYRAQNRCSIAVPTYARKRGHPSIIGWNHIAAIRALPQGMGLNAYLRQHAAETLEVPVESDSILIDLDTPEDYARLTSACPRSKAD